MSRTYEQTENDEKWAVVSSNEQQWREIIYFHKLQCISGPIKKIWIKNLVGLRKTKDFRRFGEKMSQIVSFHFKKLIFGLFSNCSFSELRWDFSLILDSLKSYKCEFSENICFGTFRHIFGYFSANFRGTFCVHPKSVVISANFAEK